MSAGLSRGGSRTAATSRMELFVITINSNHKTEGNL